MINLFLTKNAGSRKRPAQHFLMVCLTAPLCFTIACNAHELDGPTKLSGDNAAIGGINYFLDSQSSGQSWDRHISACRLANSGTGVTSIRFGSSSDDLPLTITRDASGKILAALNAPGGQVTMHEDDGCTIKLTLNSSGETTSSGKQKVDGEVKLACAQNGKNLNGSIRFQRCGE